MKKRRENKSHIEDLPEIDIIDLDQESLEEGLNLSGTDDVFTDPIQEPDSQDEEEEYLPLADTEEDTEEAAGADPAYIAEEESGDGLPEDDAAADVEADPDTAAAADTPDVKESLPDDPDVSYLKQDDSWISEDWEVGGDEEAGIPDSEEDDDDLSEPESKRKLPKINLHIIFALVLVLIIGLIGYRIWNYGVEKDLSDYVGKDEEECFDSIMPLLNKDGAQPVDDGVITILAFGNAPFSDDRDSDDNLANMIADQSGAVVYNCSVAGSYLAAQEPTLKAEEYPMDAFNFYWLTTLFCLRNNEHVYQQVFDVMGDDVPDGAREAFDTLTTIDFDTVDVITLMYDGSDYLAGHNMYSDENPTDIQQFTGNMEAGIELIQQTYPHIRIIVMSPPYAYAIDEDGNYVSSDMYRYNNQDVLSTYVIKQYGSAYTRGVTFVDHLYGTITESNADKYLTDNIHLNTEGRKLVAQRFVDALKKYTH